MALTRQEAEDRLAGMRAGLASIQFDLARQEGAIVAMEWVLARLDEPEPMETATASPPERAADPIEGR